MTAVPVFPPPPAWMARAECARLTTTGAASWDVMYPHPSDGAGVTAAKAVCATCPVRAECLAWALDTRDPHGVTGGLTPEERWLLRRRNERHQAGDDTDTTTWPLAAGVSA